MIQRRWRTFARPETVDQLEHPTAVEALALWLLGSGWVLMSLCLAHRGEQRLVTPMLAGGLLAVWAWQRDGWRRGVPWVLLAAALADLGCARRAPQLAVLGFLDVAVAGVALVSLARRVARGRMPVARVASLMPWPLAGAVVVVILFGPAGPMGLLLHAAALAAAAVAATCEPSADEGSARDSEVGP